MQVPRSFKAVCALLMWTLISTIFVSSRASANFGFSFLVAPTTTGILEGLPQDYSVKFAFMSDAKETVTANFGLSLTSVNRGPDANDKITGFTDDGKFASTCAGKTYMGTGNADNPTCTFGFSAQTTKPFGETDTDFGENLITVSFPIEVRLSNGNLVPGSPTMASGTATLFVRDVPEPGSALMVIFGSVLLFSSRFWIRFQP